MVYSSSEIGPERRLACVVSQANGEDPAGTGTPFTGYLLVEVAPPWKYDVGESRRFPEGLWEAVKGLWDASIVEKFTAIMPDPEYSREGHTAAEKPEIVGAQALLDRVRKGDVKDGASIRQIYQKGWAHLGNARKVEAALEVLQECNWLRLVKVETSGRPTYRIELHPSLRGVL